MRRSACGLGVLLAACGSSPPSSPPHSLEALAERELSVVVDFNPPLPPPTPGVIAALKFAYGGSCPTLGISSDLDGVGLAPSPNGTGATGTGCSIGFYLTSTAPAPAPTSTLRFADASGAASLTAIRLLEPRALATALADASVVHPGDVIHFTWSTDSDRIDEVDATFVLGTSKQSATPAQSGTNVDVTVPSLASGSWKLELGVIAYASVASCTNAASCSAQVFGEGAVSVTVP